MKTKAKLLTALTLAVMLTAGTLAISNGMNQDAGVSVCYIFENIPTSS